MILTLIRVNNVYRFIATHETILDKWKQYAVLLFFAVEKRADVTRFVELGSCKGNGGRGLHKCNPPRSSKPTNRTVDRAIKLRIAFDAPALDFGRTCSGNALTHHGRLVRHDRTQPHRMPNWQPFAGFHGLPSNSRSRRDHQG